jgi:hypothetical protein
MLSLTRTRALRCVHGVPVERARRLTQGRSSIIIKLHAKGDLGLQWPSEAMSKLKPISDDVFVYCEHSR